MASEDEGRVQLFGDSSPGGLRRFRNTATGQYLVPWIDDINGSNIESRRWQEQGLGTLRPPAPTDPVLAVLDTGILQEHPILAPRLKESMDFTGEGAEDRNGHGTSVAMIAVFTAPNMWLLNVKVQTDDGAPYAEQIGRIAQGVRWAIAGGANIINLSVGDGRGCREANSELCVAVKEALDANVSVVVAAEARCPAMCDDRVFAVAQVDLNTGERRGAVDGQVWVEMIYQDGPALPLQDWIARLQATRD